MLGLVLLAQQGCQSAPVATGNTSSFAPKITQQPKSVSVKSGQTATFSVKANGVMPQYQWRKNLINIMGATKSSYTTPPTKLSDSGALFSVRVSNIFGATVRND